MQMHANFLRTLMERRMTVMVSKRITFIHTSFVSVKDLKSLFKELIADAEVDLLVDDSF